MRFSSLISWGQHKLAKKFSNNRLEQDGYAAGSLTSLGVSTDGTILGNYSNGESFRSGAGGTGEFHQSERSAFAR